MSDTIKTLTIEGFKSIRKLKDFELRSVNVLIGANGAGKSNFVGFFRLLKELIEQRLQVALSTTEGGADACLYMGPKITQRFVAKLHFGNIEYAFALAPTTNNQLVFVDEATIFKAIRTSLGSGHAEARLKDLTYEPGIGGAMSGVYHYVYSAISSWVVYHFHDTSLAAGVRRQKPINDNEVLRPDGENLAAFLYRIRHANPGSYNQIRDVVRLAAPFFDDFKLRPVLTPA
jgi:predicted ATPase